MFTFGSSTSATFVLPVRHGTGVALQKRVWTVSQNPQPNRVANETPWQQWRRQGCCTERLWNQRMQIFYVEYDVKYLHPLVSKPFCAAPLPSSSLPWRLICNSVRLRILGNRPYSFLQCYTCAVTQGKKSLFSHGTGVAGFETRGCRYFMWSMMTKLKHVQQAAADLTIPTEKAFFTLQEEQSLCFLTAWQSIHLGQPRITFPSPFRVAGVGRSIITRF